VDCPWREHLFFVMASAPALWQPARSHPRARLIDECLTGVGIAIEKESHFLKVSFEHIPKQEGQVRLGWKTVEHIQELTPYGIGPTLCRTPRASVLEPTLYYPYKYVGCHAFFVTYKWVCKTQHCDMSDTRFLL
jgi:hypothetical protein